MRGNRGLQAFHRVRPPCERPEDRVSGFREIGTSETWTALWAPQGRFCRLPPAPVTG